MRNRQLRMWILVVAILTLAIPIAGTQVLKPAVTTAQVGCPEDWSSSKSADERNRCGKQKEIQAKQQEVQEQQAAASRPYVQRWPDYKPQKLAKPPDMTGPSEISLIDVAGGPAAMRDATSVWFLDYVADTDETVWSELYLISAVGGSNQDAFFQTYVLNKFTADMDRYENVWNAPEGVGALTITAISGWPDGIVSFKTATDQSGTFDFQSQEWSFQP